MPPSLPLCFPSLHLAGLSLGCFCYLCSVCSGTSLPFQDLVTILVLDMLSSVFDRIHLPHLIFKILHPSSLISVLRCLTWADTVSLRLKFAFTCHNPLKRLTFALHHSGLVSEWCVVCFSRPGASPASGLWKGLWNVLVLWGHCCTKSLHKPPWNWVTLKALGENGVRMCVRERHSNRPEEGGAWQLYSL